MKYGDQSIGLMTMRDYWIRPLVDRGEFKLLMGEPDLRAIGYKSIYDGSVFSYMGRLCRVTDRELTMLDNGFRGVVLHVKAVSL